MPRQSQVSTERELPPWGVSDFWARIWVLFAHTHIPPEKLAAMPAEEFTALENALLELLRGYPEIASA